MARKCLSLCLVVLLASASSASVYAQCAGCGADKNKAEREQIDKQRQSETLSEKQVRERTPQKSDPNTKTTDVRRVGVPNQSTQDK